VRNASNTNDFCSRKEFGDSSIRKKLFAASTSISRDIDDLQCVFFADDEEDEDCFPLLSLIPPLSINTFNFSRKIRYLTKIIYFGLGTKTPGFLVR